MSGWMHAITADVATTAGDLALFGAALANDFIGLIGTIAGIPTATGASGAEAPAPATGGGRRWEVRTLLGVLAIIVGFLVALMLLVSFSFARRRLRGMVADREGRRKTRERRTPRRVDAWAEAGRRAVLAEPGADDDEEGDPDEDREEPRT